MREKGRQNQERRKLPLLSQLSAHAAVFINAKITTLSV